jgi:hypothetical protein
MNYIPPWKITQAGFIKTALRIQNGGDEWHNKSFYIVIPLVGMFVWWPEGIDRTDEEHLYSVGWGPHGRVFYGRIVEGCDICEELMEAFNEGN